MSRAFVVSRVALVLVLLVSAARAPAQTAEVPEWQARIQRSNVLLQQGRGEEAVRDLEEARKEMEATLGPNHPGLQELVMQLARVHNQLRHSDRAGALLLPLLTSRVQAFGPDSPKVAETANLLGVVYYSQPGRLADAKALWERAIAIWEKAGAGAGSETYIAAALMNLAEMYQALDREAVAEPLLRRALAIKEKALGPAHPDVADVLTKLGNVCGDLDKFLEAERLYERALDIDVRVLGPTHPNVGALLGNLSDIDLVLGRFDQAETRSRRAVAILEAAPGPVRPALLKVILRRGGVAMGRGRYAEAETLEEEAIATLSRALGPEHPAVAQATSGLGAALAFQGKYAAAESSYRRALAIMEKAKGPAVRDVGIILGNLGLLYREMGRYAEAGAVLERSEKILTDLLGPDNPGLAMAIGNLAALRALEGRYPEAEQLYRRALALQEKAFGMDHPDVAIGLTNLSNLLREHGRPRDAEALLRRALAIQEKAYGAEHPLLATTLNNLYLALGEQGRAAEAEPLLRRALAMTERTRGAEHVNVTGSLSNLAHLLEAQGRLDEAEPLEARVLAIREKVLGPEHPDVARALNSLAFVSQDRGRNAEAEARFRRAVEVAEKALGSGHRDVAFYSLNLGAHYYAWGRPAEAVAFTDRGVLILRALLQRSFAYMSEKERLAFLDAVTVPFPIYLSLCFTYRDRMSGLVGKMYDFVLWNKGFVVGGVAALRARVEASGDAEALALLARLTASRTQLAMLLSSAPPDRTEWRATIERLENEANAFEKELVRRSTAFAEQARLSQATWKDVQQALQPGEAAVEFLRFPLHDGKRPTGASRYVALVLTPQTRDAPTLVDLGDAETLETRAFSSYASRVRSRALVHEESAGSAAPGGFHAALWRPLEAVLAGSRRVYLAPDGKLNQVSWGAVADDAGRLLIEQLDLRLLSSTRDLLRPAKAGTGTAAVLVGNPDFDLDVAPPDAQRPTVPIAGAGARSRDAHMKAQPLPATGVELQSLQASLKARGWTTEAYTGARALESTVKHVRGPRLLHLATHGFFLPDQERSLGSVGLSDRPSGAEDPMLRSGLLFAGANRALSGEATPPEREDGVLTAYEAAGLNLQGTELVVLSACETGLGEVRNGEGVFGLRRALEVAGAQSVLMSLWAVPDRETQELMGLFYEKWLSGQGKHEALRAAQLEIRQRVRTRYGQDLPYYWAAFILVGR